MKRLNEKRLRNTRELLSYVMQNCADKAIAILESGDFYRDILADVGGFSAPLPLYQLSVCQHIMLSEDWGQGLRDDVGRNLAECEKLLRYWEERYRYPVGQPMNFSPFDAYLGHFESWCRIDDLIEGTLEELLARGFDKNEVLLCYAVLIHNSRLLKRLIAKGTNPNVYVSGFYGPGMGDITSYNALVECYQRASNVIYNYAFDIYWKAYDKPLNVEQLDILILLEGAAYTHLGHQLEALSRKPKQAGE